MRTLADFEYEDSSDPYSHYVNNGETFLDVESLLASGFCGFCGCGQGSAALKHVLGGLELIAEKRPAPGRHAIPCLPIWRRLHVKTYYVQSEHVGTVGGICERKWRMARYAGRLRGNTWYRGRKGKAGMNNNGDAFKIKTPNEILEDINFWHEHMLTAELQVIPKYISINAEYLKRMKELNKPTTVYFGNNIVLTVKGK